MPWRRRADYVTSLDGATAYRAGSFDELLFNSPASPIFEPATGRYHSSPARDWLELAAKTAVDALRPRWSVGGIRRAAAHL
ncbi:MAG TPA: hypothetical protein VJ851_19385 [Jatrophihabitans sp.]|nr:hypothetical protein [Jatrophihabitans sp.]